MSVQLAGWLLGVPAHLCCLPACQPSLPFHHMPHHSMPHHSPCVPAAFCLQVGVCVIDTGIRSTHEDLAANFKGGWNRWVCIMCAGMHKYGRGVECVGPGTVRLRLGWLWQCQLASGGRWHVSWQPVGWLLPALAAP